MLVIKDFATTILASALTAAATSVVVSDASRLPALSAGDYYYLVLQKFTDRTSVEVVKVTGATGNTLTVVRAQAGTTAKSFAIGDYAEQRVTVGTFSEYIAQSVAMKVDEIGGHVEQSLGLLNTGDLVKASVGISYDATNGHGTILSGGEGANKVTPYVALRPLGVADSSVQLKYAQDGSLVLSGGSRYVETGLLSMKHPQDANGWPNAINSDANNYNSRARGKVHVNNNALYFIADAALNARRFGIQSGHEDPGYATSYGVLDLNPFGGNVRVNGGLVYHTNYVPTPAAVGALALSGGTITGSLDQNIAGYGGRMTASAGIAYLQGGKVGGDTTDQKLRITGINSVPLTEFDIITSGHGVAKANGARIYTEQYVPTPDVLGVVPQARTINSKPLTSNITLSAADVGALPVAGGTVSGMLGVTAILYLVGHSASDMADIVWSAPDGTERGRLWIGGTIGADNSLTWRSGGSGATHKIYHEGNKPTAADVGAAPAGFGLGGYGTAIGSVLGDTSLRRQSGFYQGYNIEGLPTSPHPWNYVFNQAHANAAGYFGYLAINLDCSKAWIGGQFGGGQKGPFELVKQRDRFVAMDAVGDDYNQCAVEVNGNTAIDSRPGIGFHMPGRFAGMLHLWGGGDFRFHTQGLTSYAGILTGNVNANDVYIRSDRRLKKNLVEVRDALRKVSSLTAYSYDKKQTLEATEYDKKEVGLIAQDVEQILPEAVTRVVDSSNKDGTEILTLSNSALIALLVGAVKELSEKVKELEYGRT